MESVAGVILSPSLVILSETKDLGFGSKFVLKALE